MKDRKLRILVDIGHPAHVHFFKNFIWEMEKHGHEITVTGYDKDNSDALLNLYNIPHIKTVKYGKTMGKKMYENIKLAFKLRKIIKRKKIDYALGIAAYPEAWACLGTKCKSFPFSDTEHARSQILLCKIACTHLITPTCYMRDEGNKQIRYKGYHELAYLHSKRFTPDPSVLKELDIGKGEKYLIVRFVSWTASHDIGEKGFSTEDKIKFIKAIEKHAKPFITSEGDYPDELKKYKIKIPLHRIHDALYYASLYVGEGSTMASESALLGTPSIYVNTLRMGYTNEEEKFGLIKQYQGAKNSCDDIIKDAIQMINTPKEEWNKKTKKLLEDKIDVTTFMVWLVENYPENAKIIKGDITYQERFK